MQIARNLNVSFRRIYISNICIQTEKGRFSLVGKEVKKAKAGFIVSLIGGIIILIGDIIGYVWREELMGELGFVTGAEEIVEIIFVTFFALGLLWAILVIVGAALIWTGKTTAGGVLAIVFSILSLILSLSAGGFVIGMILGIVGGALGIAKK